MAERDFGRGTLFDEYSKVLLIVNRAGNKAATAWVCEDLYVHMLRKGRDPPDNPSQSELKKKDGPLGMAMLRKQA